MQKLIYHLFSFLVWQIQENTKVYTANRGGSRSRDMSPPSDNSSSPAESDQEEDIMESEDEQEMVAQQVKRMPTPKEIMRGLNEFVIGQKRVKIALSVGVYNHYKRIFVAEAQAAAESRRMQSEGVGVSDSTTAGGSDTTFMPMGEGTSLADLNLGQYGSATTTTTDRNAPFCETPDVAATNNDSNNSNDVRADNGRSFNSISNGNFGRDVEDCEIEKSNILLLGPTGK